MCCGVTGGIEDMSGLPQRSSSCPALCRASTSSFHVLNKEVDGRDKPGHDEEQNISACGVSDIRLRAIGQAIDAVRGRIENEAVAVPRLVVTLHDLIPCRRFVTADGVG